MTIYFDCPETPEPIGGIKQIYRQVDVLNRHGMPAAVLHTTPGHRCRWFANLTRIVYAADLVPAADDVLVVPECRPAEERWISDDFPGLRRVVFNQNCYLTFKDADLRAGIAGYRTVYEDPKTVAVITVSRDSAQVLRFLFPHLDLYTVRCGIDGSVFRYAEHKDRTLSFTVRKNKVLREVVHGLRVRGSLAGVEVVPIDHVPEDVVAQVMRRSLLFLTALNYEGFGLPPAEAMASGCLVVGFDGRGGAEYFTPETGFPVPVGDIVGFIRTVESVLQRVHEDPAGLDAVRRRAADLVAAEYSLKREAASIVQAWQQILTRIRPATAGLMGSRPDGGRQPEGPAFTRTGG